MLTLKNRNFTVIKADKKNCKYFIGSLDDDYKIKPLHIILPKMSSYIKSYDGETK